MTKRLGSTFLAAMMVLVAACNSDVPLGGNDDAGPGTGGTGGSAGAAGSGGSTSDGGGPSCTSSSDCAVMQSCMLCSDGSSSCPTADCVNGQCVTNFPACAAPDCTSDSDCPQMGAPCQLCPDGSSSCPSVACVNGSCAGSFPGCSGFNPCENKRCGESCAICDPTDPDCAAPAVEMYCDQTGSCGLNYPVCQPSQCASDNDCAAPAICQLCPGGGNSCATAACVNGQCSVAWPPCDGYSPCANKLCGEQCFVCDPTDPDCVAPAVVTYCDGNGACTASFPSCGGGQCASDADCPQVGAPCSQCPDGDPSCPVSQCVNGQCAVSWPGCAGYEPCAGKSCGAACTLCDPTDPTCVETSVQKFCDANGSCGMTMPACPPGQP